MPLKQVTLSDNISSAEKNSKVSTLESMLSGVASGLISIPKGFFSLGASLMDLGSNTGKAAKVEQWFDDLTEFDEKAEATTAGKLTELLINIGVPGGLAFKGASGLAKTAMLAKQNGKYVNLINPKLVDAAGKATELTLKGKGKQFMAGAIGGGIAEGAFVGDVKAAGSFGDLLGGPTGINRNDDDAMTEVLNRVKFGTEGALFTGLIGGTGKLIKKLTNRNKQLDTANSLLDRWIDKAASGFRARSGKTQEFFDIERQSIGAQGANANVARNLSRELDTDIDALFPPMRTVLNSQSASQRNAFLEQVNELLLSGKAELDDAGKATFGKMDGSQREQLREVIKKFAPNAEKAAEIDSSIVSGLSAMRIKWGDLFSKLGESFGPEDIKQFQQLFGGKFKSYLGSTYDIFQNKSLLPWMRFKPAAGAIEDAKKSFMQSADEAGKPITDLQAEQYVANILRPESLLMPKGFRMDRPSELVFKIPDFFVNRTTLDTAITRSGEARISIAKLKSKTDQEVFNKLFGKQSNPMQTMVGGMAKLSMIVERNLFYKNLMTKNDEVVAAWRKATDKTTVAQPMFARTDAEAMSMFGNDYRKIQVIDPAQTLDVGIGKTKKPLASTPTTGSFNPFNPLGEIGEPFFARPGVADAIEKTSFTAADTGALGKLYSSLVLYPKATSQIAKTILSPVTHVRNFISAGAFATANGIIPDGAAIKQAYQALQTPLKGTRQQNELYQELLELGVVNTNVRLGDLSRLLEDVNFGSTMTSDKGLRLLLKPLSKLKSISQDLYTAEDDFWKIASWAMEKKRIEASFLKIGLTRGQYFTRNGKSIKLTDRFLKEEAADIVKNNIPNYDYVSEFVKSIRKWPIGNFVSFPAEIARTGTNIVSRALREISEEIIVNGKVHKPFQSIGYTRLFGFATTTAAVPAATVAAFQAIYDVTGDEREAIRRFAAPWSKNSTLLPMKDEDGNFKYVDFSHSNAYDTLSRPIQTVINSLADGRTDNDGIMDDFAKGIFTSMSEFAQPFISESIWTEAVLDIIARGGKTREGFQVYSQEDTPGDRNSKIMKHLVTAQMPFSIDQLRRLDRSIEAVDVITKFPGQGDDKYDEYGQNFEFGNEFSGLFGFRAVSVDPERTMNFKVADYQKGVRDSRSLFTRTALKGGPIEPREVVDAYINANRAAFDVKKNFKKDIDAARFLGISDEGLHGSTDRVSNVELNSIDEGIFRPINISPEIRAAFAENAEKIGEDNPFDEAADVIAELQSEMSSLSLDLPELPFLENPLLPQVENNDTTQPISIPNLGEVSQQTMTQTQAANQFSNLTMDQKVRLLFPNG